MNQIGLWGGSECEFKKVESLKYENPDSVLQSSISWIVAIFKMNRISNSMNYAEILFIYDMDLT